MEASSDPHLQLLSVTVMDIRATIESMLRSVTNAQSSIEVFRHTRRKQSLDDIGDCLTRLARDASAVIESTDHAREPLPMLMAGEPA
jgi:hypothetical protein